MIIIIIKYFTITYFLISRFRIFLNSFPSRFFTPRAF